MIFTISILAAGASALLVVIAALSRHKKAGSGPLSVVGASGRAHLPLNPEGFVLVEGELWPAVSVTREKIETGQTVRVVGAKATHLEVKLADEEEAQ
jgi:membrane-bound ClpP family serine protease